MTTPPSPVHGVFADDGAATRALLLAYLGGLLTVAAVILALRDPRAGAAAAAGAAIVAASFAFVSRGRKLFTSSTLWVVDHGDAYRFSAELNLRQPPTEPIGVTSGSKPLGTEPATVVRRGDTWMVVFDLKKSGAPQGRLAITFLELRSGRKLARFSLSLAA